MVFCHQNIVPTEVLHKYCLITTPSNFENDNHNESSASSDFLLKWWNEDGYRSYNRPVSPRNLLTAERPTSI